MTDPQTAADAAERVQAFLDAWDTTEYLAEMTGVAGPFDGVPALTTYDLRTLLADRKRMAAELEQVRGERKVDAERIGYATDLLTALARTSPCLQEKGGCITHDRYLPEGSDCPHGLARAFLAGAKAHRSAETTAARPAGGSDAEGAGKGPESHAEAPGRDVCPPA